MIRLQCLGLLVNMIRDILESRNESNRTCQADSTNQESKDKYSQDRTK